MDSPDSLTPERLVVARFNREAVEAVREYGRSFPDLPGSVLVIEAARGMGKTHLLHAVREEYDRERPGMEIALTGAREFIEAWEAGDRERHAIQWRNADIVFLDDAHLLFDAAPAATAVAQMAADTPDVGWVLAMEPGDRPDGPFGDWVSSATAVPIDPASPGTLERIVREAADVYGLPIDDARVSDWVQIAEGSVGHALELLHSESGAAVPGELDRPGEGEFETFLSDITATVSDIVEATPWRAQVGEAILLWEGHGFRTRPLEEALRSDDSEAAIRRLEAFEENARLLVQIRREVEDRDPDAVTDSVFRDPERLDDARARLSELSSGTRETAGPATDRRPEADDEPPAPAEPAEDVAAGSEAATGRWVRDSERVCWSYLSLDDRIVEELR